jgi:hypothetical protein
VLHAAWLKHQEAAGAAKKGRACWERESSEASWEIPRPFCASFHFSSFHHTESRLYVPPILMLPSKSRGGRAMISEGNKKLTRRLALGYGKSNVRLCYASCVTEKKINQIYIEKYFKPVFPWLIKCNDWITKP